MDDPSTLPEPGSLENLPHYDLSQDFDFNDYIDYNSHEAASETLLCADENCVDYDENSSLVESFSSIWSGGLRGDDEDGRSNGKCKRPVCNGKCSECSRISFEADLRNFIDFDIPNAPPVFAFHMPPNSIPEQLDSESFSNDMLLLQPPPNSGQNRRRPVNCEPPKNTPEKKRRLREARTDSNADDAMALLEEVLQSEKGAVLSPELLARIQQSVGKKSSPNLPSTARSSTTQHETDFASSSCHSPVPSMDAGLAGADTLPDHQERNIGSSSSNLGLSMAPRRWLNEHIPYDFRFKASSNSQTAASASSVLFSRSHGSKRSSTTLTGNFGSHRRRNSNSTLYQCTFELCEKSFLSKSDWKRHEESVHKQRYMCMECGSGIQDTRRGGYACGSFCLAGPFATLEDVKVHTIQCKTAQESGKSFTRKDHLRDHFRKHHGSVIVNEGELGWAYDVDSDWPRECGFCGTPLNEWDLRADHIELHFVNGERISAWKIPFPRSRDTKQQWPRNYQDSDDDDNEDDDDNDEDDHDFDDSKDGGGIRSFSQSAAWAERTDNQATSSGMTWSYKSDPRMQAPVQVSETFDRNEWDWADTDKASESTCPQTIVRIEEDLSKPPQESPGAETSTNSAAFNFYSPLEIYLSTQEQHERLLVGLGRQPLNIAIGPKTHIRNSKPPLHPQADFPTQNSKPSSPLLETETESESFIISEDPDPLTCLPVSQTVPKPGVNSGPAATKYIQTNDRIGYLYLENLDQPYTPGYCDWKMVAVDIEFIIRFPKSSPRIATDSTVFSRSIFSADDYSNQSSISSAASTVEMLPGWHPPTLNQQINMTPYAYGYDLPCEFEFTGCSLKFHPSQFEAWIAHTASHFSGNLPPKSICTFCDDEDTCFEDEHDLVSNWRKRMLHIGAHMQNFTPHNQRRPDYFILEYMWANGLVSVEDYSDAMSYSERPHCSHLVPLGHETSDMILKKEGNLRQVHDLAKEKRLMMNAKRRGKGKEAAHRTRETHSTQAVAKNLENCCFEVKCESERARLQTRAESRVRGSEVEVQEDQGDCIKQKSINHWSQEVDSDFSTHNSEGDTNPSREEPNQASVVPLKECRSSSEHSTASSRSRSIISSEAQTESLSRDTESSSLSGCDSPKASVTQIKQLQTLPKCCLLSEEMYFSHHVSNSASTSSPPRPRPRAVSNPALIPVRKTMDPAHFRTSRESSLVSRTSYDSGLSARRDLYAPSTSTIGYYKSSTEAVDKIKQRKYRTPDNERKYISSTLRGDVEVVNHRKAKYDPAEPRASEARPSDFHRSCLKAPNSSRYRG